MPKFSLSSENSYSHKTFVAHKMVPADDTTYLKVPPQKIGGDLKHLFDFLLLTILIILLSEDVVKGGRSYKEEDAVVVVVDVVVVAVVSLWW